jgi:class 3 adenylate cyclase
VLLAREERRRLTQTFGGYVSPQLLRAIISGQVDLRGGRRPMAFMFADLRGFTGWSERTEPEKVLDVLNRYYGVVTPIVHFHGGTIDNFRGDGIMVMFGAPEPHSAPCEGAFLAARGILAALDDLNRNQLAGYDVTLAVGIGLAYGDAVFGDLGSVDRKDFTALGDAVNVAARLQDLAKSLGFPVLMTAEFAAQLSPQTQADAAPEQLGDAPIKGHSSVAIAGWPPSGRPSPSGKSDPATVE